MKKGNVVFKCIACYKEENFEKLIKKIKKTPEYKLTSEYLFDLCNSFGFGDESNLAIQSIESTFYKKGGDNDQSRLNKLFRDPSKFANPSFNPRWERGTADYVQIIER